MTEKKLDHTVCPECGARLKEGADVCDLCGLPVGGTPIELEAGIVASEEESAFVTIPVVTETIPASGLFCNQCGWKNPPGARFCSACGSRLQEISTSSPESIGATTSTGVTPAPVVPPLVVAADPVMDQRQIRRNVGVIVGASLLLVVSLFLITVASKTGSRTTPATPAAETASSASAPAPVVGVTPLSPELERQVVTLERQIEAATGNEQVTRRKELIDVYIGAGRLDKAAGEQQKIAQSVDTPEEWTRLGNYYFDWMETLQGETKQQVARQAVDAYQKVLKVQPGNDNVRTDMAWAYQYDPVNAMEAINQTNQVLKNNPDHIQANFNKGVFLIQINRIDQAREQFEKVKRLTRPESPEYHRAEAALEAIIGMQKPTSL